MHLGTAPDGRPVKIPASADLTLEGVLRSARLDKGLDAVGIVDMQVPSVSRRVQELVGGGELAPMAGGGYRAPDGLWLLPGCELEVVGRRGPYHLLLYFPDLTSIDDFAAWLQKSVWTCPASGAGRRPRRLCAKRGSAAVPWSGPRLHSLPRPVCRGSTGLLSALREGRVVANYGLDPRLGKYHRSFCRDCRRQLAPDPPVTGCGQTGHRVIKGVLDRVHDLAPGPAGSDGRPPYFHQIPLAQLPGVGKAAREKLRVLGDEFHILHVAPSPELERAAGPGVAGMVMAAREGRLKIEPGGGGRSGRVRMRA